MCGAYVAIHNGSIMFFVIDSTTTAAPTATFVVFLLGTDALSRQGLPHTHRSRQTPRTQLIVNAKGPGVRSGYDPLR